MLAAVGEEWPTCGKASSFEVWIGVAVDESRERLTLAFQRVKVRECGIT